MERKAERVPRMNEDKVAGNGQTPNGFNRRTGNRNGRRECYGEYHLSPKRPLRDVPRSESILSPPEIS